MTDDVDGHLSRRQISLLAINELEPDPIPRRHSRAHVQAVARSIKALGFNAPILIDKNRKIIAGHGRFEAAKHLELSSGTCGFCPRSSD